MITGYDAARAAKDLENKLAVEITGLTKLVMLTAKSGIRYYPAVRDHLEMHRFVLRSEGHPREPQSRWEFSFPASSLKKKDDTNRESMSAAR
ncbi:hypothetical protein E4V51_06325, partial [Paenibacillus sp. 28ISP30-2]|nr:hypothetical protein [Paenibacillus sp. 28ISP30-2]